LIELALDALKQASDIVKALRSADSLFEKAELKLKIAELAEALATARLSVVEAQSEIQALKEQVARASSD
jgi:polyhydroxyalkanoate synthesis regulator phasin